MPDNLKIQIPAAQLKPVRTAIETTDWHGDVPTYFLAHALC